MHSLHPVSHGRNQLFRGKFQLAVLSGWQPLSLIYRTGDGSPSAIMAATVTLQGEDLKKKRVNPSIIS